MQSDQLTGVTHVLAKHRGHQVLAMSRSLNWGISDGRVAQSKSNHWRRLLQGHEFRLDPGSLGQHDLVDVGGGIVTHVHGSAAALDTSPESNVANGKVGLGVGGALGELQPVFDC